MAERRIVEKTGKGIVCFISNYSWLDGLSFTGMREKYLDVFDQIWIDNLNGDKYRTGKLTPEGKPDPSVFSTDFNREGIQVGTAIATLVRREEHQGVGEIRFRSLWGTEKRGQLIESIQPSPPAPLPKERGETESEEYRQKATQAMALIARDLRRRSTSAEVLLWEVLRSRRL